MFSKVKEDFCKRKIYEEEMRNAPQAWFHRVQRPMLSPLSTPRAYRLEDQVNVRQ
jgi:hypothetical protein